MNYLSQINPNLLLTLLTVAGGGITFLWHKLRGDKTESARDLLVNVITQVLNAPGVGLDNVKARVETAAKAAVAKMGITGALADTLVHEAVEYGAARLHEQFDALQKNLDDLVRATIAVEKATAPTGTIIPKLEIAVEQAAP